MIDPPPARRLGHDPTPAGRPQQPAAVPRSLPALATSLAVLALGCGGGQVAKLGQDVADLKEEVAELRRGQAAQRVQFDSFRNRLVMLQDRLDSERVAAARRGASRVKPGQIAGEGHRGRAAEPPALPRVVLPASPAPLASGGPASPASRRAPSASPGPPREITIGPDGVAHVSPRPAPPRPAARSAKARHKAHRTKRNPAGPSAAAGNRPPGDRPSPDEIAAGEYRRAKALLDSGRLRDARRRFEAFLRAYPRHGLADNALYWTGETWYAQAMWLKAARSFGEVVGRYPNGNKVPDAMLKTGLCYRKVGEERLATEVFRQLRDLYPGTSAARIATAKLSQMGDKP